MTSPSSMSRNYHALTSALNDPNPMQKRAMSYGNTIAGLFAEVFDTHLPADKVLANYFREHKKHGSKDRKIIRETFFALFRWWGWLKQLPTLETSPNARQVDFQHLALAATLESHPWQSVTQAWLACVGKNWEPLEPNLQLQQKATWLQSQFAGFEFRLTELLPDWFWQYCQLADESQQALIESMMSRPPIWARVQHVSRQQAVATLAQAQIDVESTPYFADAISLGTKSINLDAMTLYKQGQLEIQDLASQVIGQICAPQPDQQWWDACSGAGGKSLQLKSLMLRQNANSTGRIVASDIRPRPLQELAKRAKRAKFSGIMTKPWQSEALPVEPASFDGVLVDAPCSCLGTWRRNPDMRWVDTPSCVEQKPSLQLDILSRSSRAVKPGGTLVYATCSLAKVENEDVVQAFLQKHAEFELQPLQHPFTQIQSDTLTIWPFEANTDGMFVAKFHRKSDH